MKNPIKINNMDLYDHNKQLLFGVSFTASKGNWITMVGKSGSGKTSFLKMFQKELFSDLFLKYQDFHIEGTVGLFLEEQERVFLLTTMREELLFALSSLSQVELEERLDKVVTHFEIKNLLDVPLSTLSLGFRQLLSVLLVLIKKPDIILLDHPFTHLDMEYQEKLIHYLKNLQQAGSIIVHVTHNVEDILFGERIVVLQDGNLVFDGQTMELCQNTDVCKNLNIPKPFMVELSLKLKLYDLIEHNILDMNEMVSKLWQSK